MTGRFTRYTFASNHHTGRARHSAHVVAAIYPGSKFNPEWRGGYLLHPNALALPQVLAAVIRVHAPSVGPHLLVDAARERMLAPLDDGGRKPEDGSIRLPFSVFRPENPEHIYDSLYLTLLRLDRLCQPIDQLLLLGGRQLGILVQPQEIARRHIAARNLTLDLLVEREAIPARQRRLPVVKIQRSAPRNHIARDQPRGRRDIGIPGPDRLIAVAIEAGALRQRLRSYTSFVPFPQRVQSRRSQHYLPAATRR
jgi:hypothetical protein